MAYADLKDLNRKTAADKVFHVKAFNNAKNTKYDGCQQDLLEWLINFSIKKTAGRAVKNEIVSNKELGKEAHKPIIKKIGKEKYTHLSQMIFGVQTLQIWQNIFSSMHGLFL